MTDVVYTDGACLGNPGPGGWAWAAVSGGAASGAEAHTTNQRMEIAAALEAVRAFADRGPMEIVSDSTYVVNCFRDRWWEGWIARGWRTSSRQPVANRDLWEPLIELVRAHGQVTFRWVKGHSGDVMNELVDRLAVEAAQTQAGRVVAAPDVAAAGGGSVASRLPSSPPAAATPDPWADGAAVLGGWSVAVLGHRPAELGAPDVDGEEHPLLEALRDHLADLLAELAGRHDDLVVVSGLRLGAELAGAEAAAELGLPFAVVLPYPDPARAWAPVARQRFDHAFAAADRRVTLADTDPGSPDARAGALARRDVWIARWVDAAVVVWDGHDPMLGGVVASLRDRLGDEVRIVHPSVLVGGSG